MRYNRGMDVRNRRGATLALVAVSIFALIGIGSLAIDMGFLIKTRAEAQRAADAGALGGASAFLEDVGVAAVPKALERAVEYAGRNHMQGVNVDTLGGGGISGFWDDRNEVRVQVIPDSEKVRVWVHREGLNLFLARILGFITWDVGAMAAAEASPAGVAETCVKPFLFPDYWGELTGEDKDGDRVWDIPPEGNFKCSDAGVECWGYTQGDDSYAQYQDPDIADSNAWTGLGSNYRNGATNPDGTRYHRDYGRPVMLYPDGPKQAPIPSNFWLWRLNCPGGDCLREALASCSQLDAGVGEMIAAEQPGLVNGPMAQGLDDWMSQDESARWVEGLADANGYVHGNVVSDIPGKSGLANPRVFVAAMMRPEYMQPGYDEVPILDLAKFFLEDGPRSPSDKKNVKVRFMGFASGLGPENPDLGTLLKVLRLVE